MKYISFILIIFLACTKSVPEKEESDICYNIIIPHNSINRVVKTGVPPEEITGNFYEKEYYKKNKLVKVERYDSQNKLTDELNIPAVTVFSYSDEGKVKLIKYYDKQYRKTLENKLGYWSKEIVYSSPKITIEFFSDTSGNLLVIPDDTSERIDHIAPVIVYIKTKEGTLIKAFDSKFNLISESFGEKPCIPFIDCGENKY